MQYQTFVSCKYRDKVMGGHRVQRLQKMPLIKYNRFIVSLERRPNGSSKLV